MKGRAFATLGVLLTLLSLVASYFALTDALQGSAEAWMALSALLCAGVLGVGMVRVGVGKQEPINGLHVKFTRHRAVREEL